jgi:NAD(P)-dependent dehydrogenase (short-subunit alcohol dehydrogenase family)
MANLEGRNALITGGLGGIGMAITERYVTDGASVWVSDLASGDDPAVRDLLMRMGNRIRYLRLDVTDEADWRAAEAAVRRKDGRLDILVLNAGVGAGAPTDTLDLAEWRRIMAVNADGVFLGTRAFMSLMSDSGAARRAGASIVTMSSILGLVGYGETAAYNASKGAVRLFTKSMAIEFAARKMSIRINSIHPGFIRTEMVVGGRENGDEHAQEGATEQLVAGLERDTPMGRLGDPSEIASVAAFLASDDSSYMTGSELVVDGGWTAW